MRLLLEEVVAGGRPAGTPNQVSDELLRWSACPTGISRPWSSPLVAVSPVWAKQLIDIKALRAYRNRL